ncbi:MAG: metallophosphoesterase [Bacteroidales bacterium]|nr:metallophosphoesterase [Bacteroidales bacterium]
MRYFIPILFMTIVLAFLFAANLYLSKRFAWYFSIEKKQILYILFASVTVFMIAGLIIFTNINGIISSIIYGSAAVLMGFMLYLLISVLLVDALHFIIKLNPRTYGFASLALAMGISMYGIINSYHVRVRSFSLESDKITEDIRIMHISDVHLGHLRGQGFLENIIEKTNRENPDLIMITGDLFDGTANLNDNIFQIMKKFNAPVYFVEGNHDGYTGAEIIKQKLRNNGVHVLENEIVDFGEIQIIGLNHMSADQSTRNFHANNHKKTIEEVLSKMEIDHDKPCVLMHHSPEGLKYVSANSIELYLSGHTHGGQLFPVNLIAELMFPFNKGLHKEGESTIYVSTGVGTFGPPMRVGTVSSITLIKIKAVHPENRL